MKNFNISFLFALVASSLWGCGPDEVREISEDGVSLAYYDDAFRLFRNGEPHYIMGACILDTIGMQELAHAGGNTIRTYPGAELDVILPYADSLGLSVVVGLDMPPYRKGMDYTDAEKVDSLWLLIKQQVEEHMDQPAVLMWAIGNELPINASKKQTRAVYQTINTFSQRIHELDARHLTTYMAEGPEGAWDTYRRCKDLDIVSVNTFRSMGKLQWFLSYMDWAIEKPILYSEWGPRGYWNAPTTSWGAPIELNGEEKAAEYLAYYDAFLREGGTLGLGNCLFLWGQKQEQTHTWFSYFTEEREPTVLVDEMGFVWTGKYPENRAPLAQAIGVDTFDVSREVILETNCEYFAEGFARDMDEGDSLSFDWEITREFERGSITGGDVEIRPESMDELLLEVQKGGELIRFKTPKEPGPYRMFFYVRDNHGKAGVTNIPFYVTHPSGLKTIANVE